MDEFYTKPEIANFCISLFLKKWEFGNYDLIIEPSAGSGSFLKFLPNNTIGLDIKPKNKNIKKINFFDFVPEINKKILTIGNPPFGKRGKLSVDFFLHASKFSDEIAFIVPVQWKKWSIQNKIPKNWNLIFQEDLPENSFTFKGKEKKVRCCFQVWTKKSNIDNFRLKEKPKINHSDFKMWLYNNTKNALKFFDYNWDFAVPRQGFVDYSRRETKKENCEKTTQWIFFKAKDEEVFNRLWNINFDNLAKKNTTTPGWGKADLVELYETLYSA